MALNPHAILGITPGRTTIMGKPAAATDQDEKTPSETLLRTWALLRVLPKAPRKITAGDITSRLQTQGFKVSKRTVERDLITLSGIFPLEADERSKPFGWSWKRDADLFDLPSMTPLQALTLALAKAHLQTLLPACLMDHLAPYFKRAETELHEQSGIAAPYNAWREKVAVVPPNQPLMPPPVNGDILETVHAALFSDRQIDITYYSRHASENKEMRVHPLALVQRGPVTYLSCLVFDYDAPRSLAMHRIQRAELINEPARRPTHYRLDTQIAAGVFEFEEQGPIELEAIFSAFSGGHLYESKLAADQELTRLPDGRVHLRATVIETAQLRWWLLAFGPNVEVLAPPSLRQWMFDNLFEAAHRYRATAASPASTEGCSPVARE